MNALRIVLLVLAVVTIGALAYRMGGAPGQPTRVAATTPPAAPAPSVAAPLTPAVPPPVTGSAPSSPSVPTVAAPAAPATPEPPALPAAPPSGALPPAASMTAEDARKAIEARLQTAPDLVHVFDAIRAEFPAAADRTLSVAVETLRTTGEMPSPDDFIAAAMRDLRAGSGVLAARAGADALGAIFDAKSATLADLEAADPRICADYLFGGTSPEFSDFVASHRALVARSALVTIAAMADGRTRQINRDMPSNDDYQWLEKGLAAKGLSGAEIAALLDGKSLDPPPSDTRLCDNSRAYLDVMRAMPAEARGRIYGLAAELLARS